MRVCSTGLRAALPLTMSGTAESRSLAIRNRLNIIKQCVLRNEHFAPSTLPSRDRERLVTVRDVDLLNIPINNCYTAEVYETATWTCWRPFFTLGNACPLKGGEIVHRRR